jgi:glycosyltransferase involved in cell wall biosynthesis
MKIAILGTRGIPNHYGGFEQITEYLSAGLCKMGHEITVYNSHNHPYKKDTWKGVQIVHCYDPESRLQTFGQFIYDFNCILDARKRYFDVIIFMGYTSSSIWRRFFPKESIIISNMDGLEWKRTKYSKPVRSFLKYAEKLAVKHSHFHIADSIGIQDYLGKKYGIHAEHIPYGASLNRREKEKFLYDYQLSKQEYYLLMARMEPENNIDMILEGFSQTGSEKKFVVIGNLANSYGKHLHKKYGVDKRILFTGALFDQDLVHTLRKNSFLYFHGHSVGGTNPSLLEAMASKALIAAHDNHFNKAILNENAFYFTSPAHIKDLINKTISSRVREQMKENNFEKIREEFNWQSIVEKYEAYICSCHQETRNEKIIFNRRYAFK